MRLTKDQIQHIKKHVLSIYGKNAHVYLFGSRINDNEKGGDIDLYIEAPLNHMLTDKLKFISLV